MFFIQILYGFGGEFRDINYFFNSLQVSFYQSFWLIDMMIFTLLYDEIHLMGSAIFRMNSWYLEKEIDWNSYPKSTIYLTYGMVFQPQGYDIGCDFPAAEVWISF